MDGKGREDGAWTGGLTRMGHEWVGWRGWDMHRRFDEDGT